MHWFLCHLCSLVSNILSSLFFFFFFYFLSFLMFWHVACNVQKKKKKEKKRKKKTGPSNTTIEAVQSLPSSKKGTWRISSYILSTESDVKASIGKTWTAIDSWMTTWNFYLFFQAVAVSVLIYGCTSCFLTECMEKKIHVLFWKKILGATSHKKAPVLPFTPHLTSQVTTAGEVRTLATFSHRHYMDKSVFADQQ